MKLWLGIGTTLLIGASTYAFCPPKQNQMATVALMPSGSACTVVAACPPTPPANAVAPLRAAKMKQKQGTTRARVADELLHERQALQKARAALETSLGDGQRAESRALLEHRQAELNAVQAELEAKRGGAHARFADKVLEANKLRGAVDKQAVEHALKAARELDGEKIKLMTERLRFAGDTVPAAEAAMLDARRALEVAVAKGAADACEKACAEACAEACEAACEEACADAVAVANDAAVATVVASDAAGEWADMVAAGEWADVVAAGEWLEADAPTVMAVTEDGKTVTTYSVDSTAPEDSVIVLEGGEVTSARKAFALGGSAISVMGVGEGGKPKTRVMRIGGVGGGDAAPRVRKVVRGGEGIDGMKMKRIAPGAYKLRMPGSGGGGNAGEHEQILDQLKELTEEVRALREEVRALRANNRVTETY